MSTAPDVSETVFDDAVAAVAKTYSEALVNAAANNGEADEVVGELEELYDDLIRNNARFAELFASPSIPTPERDRMLSQAFDHRARPTVVRFLRVLNQHGRLGVLGPVVHEARALWDKRQGRIPVIVRSAVPLDDDQKQAVQTKVAGMIHGTPVLHLQIDPSLIGGLVIQIGDDLYDASVKTKLERFRRRLVEVKSREIADRSDLVVESSRSG